MTTNLYIKYKSETGKEPIVFVNSDTFLGVELVKAEDLASIATSEDEDEFYTCQYIEWLESKIES